MAKKPVKKKVKAPGKVKPVKKNVKDPSKEK